MNIWINVSTPSSHPSFLSFPQATTLKCCICMGCKLNAWSCKTRVHAFLIHVNGMILWFHSIALFIPLYVLASNYMAVCIHTLFILKYYQNLEPPSITFNLEILSVMARHHVKDKWGSILGFQCLEPTCGCMHSSSRLVQLVREAGLCPHTLANQGQFILYSLSYNWFQCIPYAYDFFPSVSSKF